MRFFIVLIAAIIFTGVNGDGTREVLGTQVGGIKPNRSERIFCVATRIFGCEPQWLVVADKLREKYLKLAVLLNESEPNVLAYMSFHKMHREQIASTNPLERRNAEVMRCTDVIGAF